MAEASDAELVRGLRAADPASFDAAYERYRAPLYAFLLRLSRRRWLAEDLLQETWLRLARKATELDADTNLRAWLFTVARNLFVSHRRWALLDAERLREIGLWPRRELDADTPFEHAAANQAQSRLEHALGALPYEAREVLLLCAVERLTPAEAAPVLNLQPDAVRQRLSRARAMLAEHLARAERKP